MAEETRIHGVSATTHRQACKLHDNAKTPMCSGAMKRGRACVKRAPDTPVPRMMPTCKIHRDQLRVAGWCRKPLSCGFECGRLFEWKPHGFQLCPGHRGSETTCHFLNIPQEMRLCVYQFLLPDRPIPARSVGLRNLRTDGAGVQTAILRVSRQIHDEAAGLLYSTRVFTIELTEKGLRMCNTYARHEPEGHHSRALQDYHLQLMLLEEQNRRRRIRALREQDNLDGEQNSTHTSAIRGIRRPIRSPNHFAHGPIENLWYPALSGRYFNMIRSFLIEIKFPSLRGSVSDNYRVYGPSNEGRTEAAELRLYEYCDSLHRLIGRLQLLQRPIAHLQFIIELGDAYLTREEAFSVTQLLLRPFRRLHHVTRPQVLSVKMKEVPGRETELLGPRQTLSAAEMAFADYTQRWARDLSSSQPSFECPQILDAYWKLEKLVASIKEQCYNAEPIFDQFEGLLPAARIAREANDFKRFKEVWDQVVKIWIGYVDDRLEFQANVASSIDAICDIVGKGSLGSGEGGGKSS